MQYEHRVVAGYEYGRLVLRHDCPLRNCIGRYDAPMNMILGPRMEWDDFDTNLTMDSMNASADSDDCRTDVANQMVVVIDESRLVAGRNNVLFPFEYRIQKILFKSSRKEPD